MDKKNKSFSVEYKDDIPVIRIGEDIHSSHVMELRNTIRETIGQHKRIVIVVGKDNYLDDATLGTIVSGFKMAYQEEVKMSIFCESEKQYKTFEILSLNKVFPVFMSMEEAMAYLTDEKSKG